MATRDYRKVNLNESPVMVGSKFAVQWKSDVFLSPAMWHLLEDLDYDDMADLLNQIPVRVLTGAEFFLFRTQGKLPPSGG